MERLFRPYSISWHVLDPTLSKILSLMQVTMCQENNENRLMSHLLDNRKNNHLHSKGQSFGHAQGEINYFQRC